MTQFKVETSDKIKVEHYRGENVLTFEASDSEVLKNLTADDCINHFGADKFLDEIGQEKAIEHFDIQVADDD